MPTGLRNIAQDVFNHVRSKADDDRPLWERHYDPNFVSVEQDGMSHSGWDEVKEKHDRWRDMMIVHHTTEAGPFLGHEPEPGTGTFAIYFTIDAETKDGSMPRRTLSEVGVYHVRGGKVVREEFLGIDDPAAR